MSYPFDPSERARHAAQCRWANTPDRSAATIPGRRKFLSRFEDDDDRRSYFTGMSRKGVAARRRKAATSGPKTENTREMTERERTAQGLPPTVADPAALRQVARLVGGASHV